MSTPTPPDQPPEPATPGEPELSPPGGNVWWNVAVAGMTVLSATLVCIGVLFLVFTGMCVDNYQSCFIQGAPLVASCVATAAIPVMFQIWGTKAATRRAIGGRLLICLAGYMLPIVGAVLSWVLGAVVSGSF